MAVLKTWNGSEWVEVGGATGNDSDAIHDNVSQEINAITEKASPVNADVIVLEDSEDSYTKKKSQLGNLPGGGGTPGGSDTQVQYNNAGAFGGITNVTSNGTEMAIGTPTSGTLTNCTGLPTAGILDEAVTHAKLQHITGPTLLGRTAGTGDPSAISSANVRTIAQLNAAAKGDIIGASAANTPSMLTVGTNLDHLIADSAETTGLKWVTSDIRARVELTGDFGPLTSGSTNDIDWDTEIYDTDAMVDLGTNAERITVKTSGVWLVTCNWLCTSITSSFAYTVAIKHYDDSAASLVGNAGWEYKLGGHYGNVHGVVRADANDYFYVQCTPTTTLRYFRDNAAVYFAAHLLWRT